MTVIALPLIVASAVAMLAGPPSLEASDGAGVVREISFRSAGRVRSCVLYAPALAAHRKAPLLVLLHGSGQRARTILEHWTALAQREGVVLLAPEALDADVWHIDADDPRLLRDAIGQAQSRHRIDVRRVYLFGHSGGAVYALTLAMLESEYFAAAAVHAGAWRDRASFGALRLASRKIPVALYVGDIDEFFPVRSVRQTEHALREAGHPVSVTVLKGHGHAYRRVAGRINPEIWTWLAGHALTADPRFQSHD